MKTYLIIFSLVLSFPAQSQIIPSDQLGQDTTKLEYCMLIGTHRLFTATKVDIVLDFGEKKNYWKDQRLRDEQTGKVKVFNSMIEALNYMSNERWEFVQGYLASSGQQTIHHWLLKRRRN